MLAMVREIIDIVAIFAFRFKFIIITTLLRENNLIFVSVKRENEKDILLIG